MQVDKKKQEKFQLSKKIAKNVGKAIFDYSMIQEGDNILVGLSGGKDSNVLLYALARLQGRSPVAFTLRACTVDPTEEGTDTACLSDYADRLNVPHERVHHPIFRILDMSRDSSPCSLCANIRRGILASHARAHGCNVLALGHHRDDAIETALLNLFYAGRFASFEPSMYMSRTDIRVIRPMVYVAEAEIQRQANALGTPIVDFGCRHAPSSYRTRVKALLADLQAESPDVAGNIMHALE